MDGAKAPEKLLSFVNASASIFKSTIEQIQHPQRRVNHRRYLQRQLHVTSPPSAFRRPYSRRRQKRLQQQQQQQQHFSHHHQQQGLNMPLTPLSIATRVISTVPPVRASPLHAASITDANVNDFQPCAATAQKPSTFCFSTFDATVTGARQNSAMPLADTEVAVPCGVVSTSSSQHQQPAFPTPGETAPPSFSDVDEAYLHFQIDELEKWCHLQDSSTFARLGFEEMPGFPGPFSSIGFTRTMSEPFSTSATMWQDNKGSPDSFDRLGDHSTAVVSLPPSVGEARQERRVILTQGCEAGQTDSSSADVDTHFARSLGKGYECLASRMTADHSITPSPENSGKLIEEDDVRFREDDDDEVFQYSPLEPKEDESFDEGLSINSLRKEDRLPPFSVFLSPLSLL